MIQLAPLETCTGCSACKAVCPKDALAMIADREGFLRPALNSKRCISCHACEAVCPILHPRAPDKSPQCYAVKAQDAGVREASTSGGLFTLLARQIIEQGGVVFGCILEKPSLAAVHVKAVSLDGLAAMRGSKYVQSDLRDTFREVKAELAHGRAVLFSGTPCQIAGLKRFIGRQDEQLLLVEIMCYGVPSPELLRRYKRDCEKQEKKTMTSLLFRQKNPSWHNSQVIREFDDGTRTAERVYDNFYVRLFFENLALRPSCHRCTMREGRSGADLTLGDFWGIESVAPELDDDSGVSALLIHTPHGRSVWETIAPQTIAKSVAYDQVLAGNPFYRTVVSPDPDRARFMRLFTRMPLAKALKYTRKGPWYKRLITRWKKKISRK